MPRRRSRPCASSPSAESVRDRRRGLGAGRARARCGREARARGAACCGSVAHRRRRLLRRCHRPRAPPRWPGRGAARSSGTRRRRRDPHAGRGDRRGAHGDRARPRRRRGRAGASDAAIFDAHLALLEDEALLEPARAAIADGAAAERAFMTPPSRWRRCTAALTSPCSRSGRPTCSTWAGASSAITGSGADDGGRASGIVVADELTPPMPPAWTPSGCWPSPPRAAPPPRTRPSWRARSGCPRSSAWAPGCSGRRRDHAAARRRGGDGDRRPARGHGE